MRELALPLCLACENRTSALSGMGELLVTAQLALTSELVDLLLQNMVIPQFCYRFLGQSTWHDAMSTDTWLVSLVEPSNAGNTTRRA